MAEGYVRFLEEHGLAGLAWAGRTDKRPIDARTGPEARLREAYLGQMVRNLTATAQIEELAQSFHPHGLRLLALKGAAAILWLYEDPGRRFLSDIDLLVEPAALPHVDEVLRGLGYQRLGEYCSPEDEVARFRTHHLLPYLRPHSLPVEIHGALLAGFGDDRRALGEAWERAVPVSCGRANLWRLSAEHFLLHACSHFVRHFELHGRAPLKDLADMAALLERTGPQFDWDEFWQSAERWRMRRQAAVGIATLHSQLGLGVTGLPQDARGLSLELLARGWPPGWHDPRAATPSGYWKRLLIAGSLPRGRARIHYLFRLVFPSPANLRARYKLEPSQSLIPYYLYHPIAIRGRFSAGVVAWLATRPGRLHAQRVHTG